MVEVTIDSIRVSLMSPHRLVVLKDTAQERYLTIWIGPCESDAITAELQGQVSPRPLTHDLLKSLISTLGARVEYIFINDLRDDVYYARIVMDVNGRLIDVDARPSDAIALAVRVRAPIYVHEAVMERAAILPEQEIESDPSTSSATEIAGDDERLDIFKSFVDTLPFDDDEPEKE
ncbi:MAG: bifunctional nuclease family protein [Chloroflexi bacterium]|nr:bifunctional nuclease family protein [Chloroflexota bacterium]